MVVVDLEVAGGRCCNELGCDRSPELTANNLFWARGLITIDSFQNSTALRSPLSSVVERVTRNDEVGCSIQPAGKLFIFTSSFFLFTRWP